jgi:hypothetical protein
VVVIGVVLALTPLSGLAATIGLAVLPLLVYIGYDDRLDSAARRDVASRLARALRPKVAGPFDDLPAERFLAQLDAARRGG